MSGWQGGERSTAGVEGEDINHQSPGLLTRLPEESRLPVLLSYHQLYPHPGVHVCVRARAHTHTHTHTHRVTAAHSSLQRLILKTDFLVPRGCSLHVGRPLKICHFKDERRTLVKTNLHEEILWGCILVQQPHLHL